VRDVREFKDIHKGERCFVIGTGPSLNSTNFGLLKDEITFGVNTLYVGLDRFKIKPRYWGISDPQIMTGHYTQVSKLDTTIFLAHNAHKIYASNPTRYKSHQEPVLLRSYGKFSIDLTKGVACGMTVVYDIGLQVAYYMGFDVVYLLGVDADYSGPKSHFYDNPDKRGKGIPSARSLQSYGAAKVAFEKDGREIINCTVGGKLEVFKRRKLEDVINEKH